MAMVGMTRTTLLFIRKALEHCGHCPGFHGAVLASPEGLVLASHGAFSGDEPAACASSIVVSTQTCFGALTTSRMNEIMIWGDQELWSILVLPLDYILLVASKEPAGHAQLRQVSRESSTMLVQALRLLA